MTSKITTISLDREEIDLAKIESLGKVGQAHYIATKDGQREFTLGGRVVGEAIEGIVVRFPPEGQSRRPKFRRALEVEVGSYKKQAAIAEKHAARVANPEWVPSDRFAKHPLLKGRDVTAVSRPSGSDNPFSMIGGSTLIDAVPPVEGLESTVAYLERRYRIRFEMVAGDKLLGSSPGGRLRGDLAELIAHLAPLIVGLKTGRRVKCVLCPAKTARDAEVVLEVNVPSCTEHSKAPRKV